MKKKLLAILLAAIMVMTLLPTMAFAATEPNVITNIDITVGNFTNPESTIPEVKINGIDAANVPNLNCSAAFMFFDAEGDYKYYCVNGEWLGSEPESQADLAGLDVVLQVGILDEIAGDDNEDISDAANVFDIDNVVVTVNGETYSKLTEEDVAEGMTTPGYLEVNPKVNLWVLIPLEPAPSTSKGAEIKGKITPADFSYSMVIPADTTLDESNYKEGVLLGSGDKAGLVSIENIKHPATNIDVFYTVDLTDGNLTDGTTTITTNYGISDAADGEFDDLEEDTQYTVYTGGTVKDTYVKVSADETSWKAAPVGDYNATVVFNFDDAEVVTIGDIMPDSIKIASLDDIYLKGYYDYENMMMAVVAEDGGTMAETFPNAVGKFGFVVGAELFFTLPLDTQLTETDSGYQYAGNVTVNTGGNYDVVVTFKMANDDLTEITINMNSSTYTFVPAVTTTVAELASDVSDWTSNEADGCKLTYEDGNLILYQNEDLVDTLPGNTVLTYMTLSNGFYGFVHAGESISYTFIMKKEDDSFVGISVDGGNVTGDYMNPSAIE